MQHGNLNYLSLRGLGSYLASGSFTERVQLRSKYILKDGTMGWTLTSLNQERTSCNKVNSMPL